MKDLLLLLLLLDHNTIKVCSLPYQPLSNGSCLKTSDYLEEDVNRCCRRCPPGQRRVRCCTTTEDTVCGPCDGNQYMERWNYSPNCLACSTCRSNKGLEVANECLPTRASKCKCKSGHFCIMKFNDPYCSDCQKYLVCQAGYGVAEQGTANSNVKCKLCPEGSFSDTASSSLRCQPHTRCQGRVIRNGTSISDVLCEPEYHPKTTTITVTSLRTTPTREPTNSTVVRTTQWHMLSPSKKAEEKANIDFVAAIAGALGVFFISLFIAVVVFLIWKRKKDCRRYVPELDANGNCGGGYEIRQDYCGKAELMLSNAPEERLMLLNQAADQTVCGGNNDARTKSLSTEESIGPLLSNVLFHNPPNPESVTLVSKTEPISTHSGIRRDSSQPSSPHIVNPQATSPQVNVNITFHIGNGGSVKATERSNSETLPPEEQFSIPQQEAGKEIVLSVEEEARGSK